MLLQWLFLLMLGAFCELLRSTNCATHSIDGLAPTLSLFLTQSLTLCCEGRAGYETTVHTFVMLGWWGSWGLARAALHEIHTVRTAPNRASFPSHVRPCRAPRRAVRMVARWGGLSSEPGRGKLGRGGLDIGRGAVRSGRSQNWCLCNTCLLCYGCYGSRCLGLDVPGLGGEGGAGHAHQLC